MLAERVSAAQLQRFGLVHSVTEPGSALNEAMNLARRLNARAPNALASIKEPQRGRAEHAGRPVGFGASTSCVTSFMPTPASASRPSSTRRHPNTRPDPVAATALVVTQGTFFRTLVADKTSHGRAHPYDRRTRGHQQRGRWFSSLSSLRHDILRCAYVKRFKDNELIARAATRLKSGRPARGEPCGPRSTSLSGKQITLTYVEPGVWFGDVAIFDGDRRTHDATRTATRRCCVSPIRFQEDFATHVELYEASVRLQARRIRQLYGLVEDLNTLPLRARLAKQLLHLVRSYGVPCLSQAHETRIGLQLAQEERERWAHHDSGSIRNSRPWSARAPSASSPVASWCAIGNAHGHRRERKLAATRTQLAAPLPRHD